MTVAAWSFEAMEPLYHREANIEWFGAPDDDPERDWWNHEAERVFEDAADELEAQP